MRWTLLLSMLLAGVTAQAQAAVITIPDAPRAAVAGGTKLAGPAVAYDKLGGVSLADMVAALTAADVALLRNPANLPLNRDVFTHPLLMSDEAPQIHNSPAPIPEPATLPLLAGSLAALALAGIGSRRAAPVKAT